MTPLLFGAAAYLLGSIPVGYLLMKWGKGVDIRTQGSGNIGMTNVWRVAGAKWGIPTLVLDITKGALAVAIARWGAPGDARLQTICGFLALIGNIFPVFLGFKGGKGIGVSVGVFFSLLPVPSTMGLAAFALAVLLTRMISVGSLLGATVMVLTALFRHEEPWFSGLAITAAVLIWWTHRENIRRILKGTENRIGKRKRA